MTKKELLDNEIFAAMPDDAEIVFATDVKCENCRPLMPEDICYQSEIVGWAQKDIKLREEGIDEKEPIFRHYIVIER